MTTDTTRGAEALGRVLVTGAGGFVGGRIAEVLCSQGVDVRAGLRRWGSAARIGRFPVDLVLCDVMDPASIDAALEGVDRVVHCAVGDRAVTVEGTRNMLQAAARANLRRFVHISTIDVYGDATGEVDETTPFGRTGRAYGDAKIEAEEACQEAIAQGLPVTILRPTLIHGPFSESWTIEWASRLQDRPWLLSEADCQGICNLLYVDDLVRAVRLALVREEAVGQAFNVNGPDRPTWQEYFEALNRALDLPLLVSQSKATSRLSAGVMQPVRSFAKFLLAHFEGPIMGLYQRSVLAKRLMLVAERAIKKTPTTSEFGLLTKRATFPTAKADALLGWVPRIDMTQGIDYSAAWLAHHGHLRDRPPL
jgi:nucleoside-diphosphate-sugar epimerase